MSKLRVPLLACDKAETRYLRESGGRDQFGNGSKFMTPMIVNGKVFVDTLKRCPFLDHCLSS